MKMVKAFVTRLFKNESGAGMTEYALLVALVGVLLIGTIFALTGGIETAFDEATTALGGTPGLPIQLPG